ncbi:hypothetical protein [uncultured Sunxiuqinia sp.]|uniref:hypothetical protein n=1 Tax=uncultured Sunxiuqinia sp. TaxID=1573825 RepID=UPI002AA8676A|nr:hypothetical protein [uncultured Sunxiuqinia sp.]
MNLDISIDFRKKEIQKFLIDEKDSNRNYQQNFDIPSGFELKDEELDSRINPNPSQTEEIPFLVTKRFAVEQALGDYDHHDCEVNSPKTRKGIIKIQEARTQILNLNCSYYLLLKSDLNQSVIDECRRLFNLYNATDNPNIEDWILNNANQEINSSMFKVISTMTLEKVGDIPTSRNKAQEEALYEKYCRDRETRSVEVDINNDNTRIPYSDWVKDSRLGLIELDSKIYIEPEENSNVQDVDDPEDINVARQIGQEITDVIIDLDCKKDPGVKPYTKKILTLLRWPEFKIEWKRKTIKIGCSKITIVYPKLYTRTVSLVLYAHYVVPTNLGLIIRSALEKCAIVSALQGGVAGVVMGNLPVAIAVFQTSFKICMEEYLLSCIYPSLLLLKNKSEWGGVLKTHHNNGYK